MACKDCVRAAWPAALSAVESEASAASAQSGRRSSALASVAYVPSGRQSPDLCTMTPTVVSATEDLSLRYVSRAKVSSEVYAPGRMRRPPPRGPPPESSPGIIRPPGRRPVDEATAADLLFREVKHAVIPSGQRRTFSFYTCLQEMFSHIGSLLTRRAGLASGIWTALAVTGRRRLMAGRERYGKGQHGKVPLSEKWIGICLRQREIGKGIGQVGSGKVFWFSRQQSEASWPMYAWSFSHGFCIPQG